MNHLKLKAAVKKHSEAFIERGEDEVRQLLEIDEFTKEESDEVIGAIKAAILESMKGGNKSSASSASSEIARNTNPLKPGHKEYDLYNVSPDMVPSEKDPSKQVFAGTFTKVGKPIKTNIRVEPFRAEALNEQSFNSRQMLFEVGAE